MDQLTEATTEAFQQYPDYAVITSFPGLADLSGARVLGEIGDDRERFTDARSLKDLRRFCADHAGLRAQHLDYPPRGEEQPTQRCRIPLGVRRDGESRRTPRPLTPRTRPRRSARRCASAPLRPLARAAPLLLANRSALRPDQGVRARSGRVLRDRGLTSWCDRRSSSARSRPISTPNSPSSARPGTGPCGCATPVLSQQHGASPAGSMSASASGRASWV